MTSSQITIVNGWKKIFISLLLLVFFYVFGGDKKQLILAFISISSVFWLMLDDGVRGMKDYGASSIQLGEFVEKKPRLKVYLIFYCFTILPFMLYSIYIKSNNLGLYFLSIGLLVGPLFIASEIDRFRAADENT